MFCEINKNNISLFDDFFSHKEILVSELKNNPFARIIAYKEESIIGYIYYSKIYERVEINQIEVKKSYRNKGVGSQLLNYLIEKEKRDITLEVRKDNYPAIALYKKYGFVERAIRENYYQGIDGILMERVK